VEFSKIGTLIRDIRKSLKITQEEIASGICTQGLISRIEKGEHIPSADILYKIAKKLGLDVNYFFHYAETPSLTYIEEVMYQVRKSIRERSYHEVEEIIKIEMKNPLFQTPTFKQFLLWHKGICTYYIQADIEKAMSLMQEALNLSETGNNAYSEREIEILNSIAILHSEVGQHKRAIETLEKAMVHLKNLSCKKDVHIEIRLLYNLAKFLWFEGAYADSIQFCERGSKLCLQYESFYLYGELTFQHGYNLMKLNKKKEAIVYFYKARSIFQLQNNSHFVSYIDEEIAYLN
jgi:transcriptional regulator with XRE-family HTH domain